MHLKKTVCLLTLSLGAFAQATQPAKKAAPVAASKAKDSRGIDETFAWVKQQIEASAGITYQVTYVEKGYQWQHTNGYTNLTMKDCQMVMDQVYHNNQRPEMSLRYTVPLWDIASADFQLDRGSKQFKYTPAVPALFLHSRNNEMHWTKPRTFFPTGVVEIQFGRDPAFTRGKIREVGDAFMHLQELCAPMAPKKPVAAQPLAKPAANGSSAGTSSN